MICPKCGTPLPDGSTLCPNCGVSLAIQQQYAQPQQQYAQPQQQYAQPQQQYSQPQQQYAQPQQQYSQPQQQYAQPQQQYAQPQQQYAQPQQQYAQPQQQYAQPQQQYAQPQQQYAQPQYAMPYGGMAPAKKSNVGVIIGICAGAAVLIAGVVILLIFLLGGVHGKDYTAKLNLGGSTQSYTGKYSGGWENEKPQGNGTLDCTMKLSGQEYIVKISGNWKDGVLNGDGCTFTASATNPENSAERITIEYKGKFEEGKLTNGSLRQEAFYSEGRMLYTATYEDGREKNEETKYYDKDGNEVTY